MTQKRIKLKTINNQELVGDGDISVASSSHTHTKSQITDFPTLSNVATSGSYADLSNKPSYTATVTSSTNGAYKIGSINISGSSVDIYGKDTDTHQSLSGYLQTSDVKDNLTSTDTNKPLSANQGKELKTLIKSNSTHTTTPNYILDDGWVIGFTYDYSGTDYQTSKIIVGDGTDNLSLTFDGGNLTIVDDATGDMWMTPIPFQAPHTMSLTVGSLDDATESNGRVSYYITVTMDGYENLFSAQYSLAQNETKEKYFRHYNCLREITSGYNSSITNLSITPTPKFSETINNKVSSWSSTTTDTHYPSEKLVKDSLDGKIDTNLTYATATGNNDYILCKTYDDGKIHTTQEIKSNWVKEPVAHTGTGGIGSASGDAQLTINTNINTRLVDLTANKVNTSDIADNLTTNDATKVLSAKQGKALNDLIGSAITYINQ